MIVAAIDISYSTDLIDCYKNSVYSVLRKLQPPIHVIYWHSFATKITIERVEENLGYNRGLGYTEPQCFVELLSGKNDPIDLYVFTDGAVTNLQVQKCKQILKREKVLISSVQFYFIGDAKNMNFNFVKIFEGVSQEIYINGESNFIETFNEQYFSPEIFFLWQLWKTLCEQSKFAIFNILAHYFHHEVYDDVPESKFQIVLYASGWKKRNLHLTYEFLGHLNLKTVLCVYKNFIKTKSPTADRMTFEDVNDESVFEDFIDDQNETNNKLLDHIQINLVTCHPLVICRTSKKHWKECVEKYNPIRHSYIRLFRRYCEKYKKYPQSPSELIVFLNEYIFVKQDGIPAIFSTSLISNFEKVLMIFKEVMTTYSCSDYLRLARKYHSEARRLTCE